MNIRYFREYSRHLGREMEFKAYGHGGIPLIAVPCQCGRFYEFEDMGMLSVYAPYIEDGRVQVFTVDSLDGETLAAWRDEPRRRIERHESWIRYLVEEALPRFREISGATGRFAVTGVSLGALHAATLYFRFPELFDRVLCLSGAYTNEYFFGGYHDALTYENSPQQFLKNMPDDHPYLQKYRAGKIILCVGQGDWEIETLESTRAFANVLAEKKVGAWVDFWGRDVRHDWDWWYRQAAYFLPYLLQT